ncbi:hypothetical protein ACTFIR_003916 [Dictyostelium discoideum]
MEAMSGLPTTHSFAFYPGEDELIQFEEGFYNTDLPNLEISNLVSDDSSSSSSSSSSHVSSSTGNIPRTEIAEFCVTGAINLKISNVVEFGLVMTLLIVWSILLEMFGLARSSDLVKWSFNGLIITPDSKVFYQS